MFISDYAGAAVAAGRWVWLSDKNKLLKNPRPKRLTAPRQPYESGDIVERGRDGVIHYVWRKDIPWRKEDIWISPDAIEAVLRDCEGVREARVDRIVHDSTQVRVDLTVQAGPEGIKEMTIRHFFDRNARKSNLKEIVVNKTQKQVIIGNINFGGVEMTPTGKPVRKLESVPNESDGRLFKSRPWKEFDLSRLQSGPLYFYVGAGLSMDL